MRLGRSADRRRWPVDDRGAVAIFLSLMMVLVLLPLSALGLSTYVRGTLRSELQRAADSAALAGAASIPLGDLDFAKAYALGTVGPTTLPPLPGDPLGTPLGTGVDPLQNSCDQARRAARQAGSMGDHYAEATTAGGGTCRPPSTSRLSRVDAAGFVTARYVADPALLRTLDRCVGTVLTTTTSTLPAIPPDVPLPPLSVPTLPSLEALGRTLPALLQPGVRVTTRWRARGPLDQLLGGSRSTEMTGSATARRRLKNAVVLPVLSVAGRRIAVAGDVIRTTDQAQATLRALAEVAADPDRTVDRVLGVVPDTVGTPPVQAGPVTLAPIVVDPDVTVDLGLPGAPRDCTVAVLDALADDYEDLVDPQDNPRDQAEIVREAACLPGSECDANGGRPTPLLTLLVGPGPTLYDTVPVCFPPDADVVPSASASVTIDGTRLTVDYQVDGGVLSGVRCAPGTPGAFRATLTRS